MSAALANNGEGEAPNNGSQPEGQAAGENAETNASDAAGKMPTSYEPFTLPDGYTAAEEDLKVFTDLGQSLGLDQAGAQSLLDLGVQLVESNTQQLLALQEQQAAAEVDGWKERLRNDPELGGQNSERTQKNVARFEQLGLASEGLVELLHEKGLVYHPEVQRLFDKIGALSQEDPITFGSGPASSGQSAAQRMFANSNMQ